MISLDALHSATIGVPPPRWTDAVGALVRENLTDASAARATAQLEAFGVLIGNTDMHAGNLSFWLDDSLPFRLAPAYDMLPMLWAPGVHGEITSRAFEPTRPAGIADDIWDEVSGWAGGFWRGLLEDPRLSGDFARLVMASPGIRHLCDLWNSA